MNERTLEILFLKFLQTKGYSGDNYLSQFSTIERENIPFRPDLILVDTRNNNYIGLVEFKSRIDRRVEQITIGQFYKYFGFLGSRKLPAYLVIPLEDDDFQIFELTEENTFIAITKDDFPKFETLSARILIDEKIIQREIEEKKVKELEDKKNRAVTSSIFAILSIVIGVLTSLSAIYFQQKGIKFSDDKQIVCCDTLDNHIANLNKRISILENNLGVFKDSTKTIDTIYVTTNINKIENRLNAIEKTIISNPENLTTLQQFKIEIELLKRNNEHIKELTQTRFDAIQNEFDTQNTWLLAVIIAVFGSILAYAIPNILTKWNEKK
jgi:hypothetical protein